MGAGNVKLAYGHYAGKVPPGSLLVLVFMALVTKDSDDPPLFWGGHDSLALSVLGRNGSFTETDARAVRKLITPLVKAGAIETERHSAPGRRVRYRINLHPNTGPKESGEHRTESVGNTGPKATGESSNIGPNQVGTPDRIGPTQEQEEELLQDISRTKARPGAQGSARAHPRATKDGSDEDRPRECVSCRRPFPRHVTPPGDGLCTTCTQDRINEHRATKGQTA